MSNIIAIDKNKNIIEKMEKLSIPNPYNNINKKINYEFLSNIFKKYGLNKVKIHNIENYQNAFIHKSYLHNKVNHFFKKNKLKLNDLKIPENTMKLYPKSNERLEFLGDSIIDSIIVSYLFRRFPNSDEGFMTKLKSRIVCTDTLGNFSKTLNLGEYLVISPYVENEKVTI